EDHAVVSRLGLRCSTYQNASCDQSTASQLLRSASWPPAPAYSLLDQVIHRGRQPQHNWARLLEEAAQGRDTDSRVHALDKKQWLAPQIERSIHPPRASSPLHTHH